MDFQGHILNVLLDKYEASRHYQGDAVVNRKVRFSFKRRNMPAYWDIEHPHVKLAIHQSVQELAKQGILSLTWLPFEKGNLLDDVVLNLEKLDEAYSLVNRVPKSEAVDQLQERLKELERQITLPWIKVFLNGAREESLSSKGFPPLVPQEPEERELLFQALLGLEELQGRQISERVFSKKYLGNSKVFQRKLKKRLATIAKQFIFDNQEISDDDIMAELGIEKTTEEMLLKGSLAFKYKDQVIDYGMFPFGGIIDTSFARQMEINWVNAKVVLTVENKSNFHYLASKELPSYILLIYTGGFPGPRKRELLSKISAFDLENQLDIAYYHWGDIDVGGFRIYKVLQKVLPKLEPLFMDLETTKEYQEYGEEINKAYSSQLQKLLEDQNYQEFQEVIIYLLENKVRLEQEALLISDDLLNELESKLKY